MYTSDKKMLELFELLKSKGEIRTQVDFCEVIDMPFQNFTNIKNESGRPMHFTPEHIQNAIRKWGVDANWFFGVASTPFPVTQPVT